MVDAVREGQGHAGSTPATSTIPKFRRVLSAANRRGGARRNFFGRASSGAVRGRGSCGQGSAARGRRERWVRLAQPPTPPSSPCFVSADPVFSAPRFTRVVAAQRAVRREAGGARREAPLRGDAVGDARLRLRPPRPGQAAHAVCAGVVSGARDRGVTGRFGRWFLDGAFTALGGCSSDGGSFRV